MIFSLELPTALVKKIVAIMIRANSDASACMDLSKEVEVASKSLLKKRFGLCQIEKHDFGMGVCLDVH